MSTLKGPERIDRQTENYTKMLYRYPSPELGNRTHTPEEIAEVLHLPLSIVKSILGLRDPYHPPLPQVRNGQIPDNERAFFLGLAMFSNFQIHPVQRGRERFVVVVTESANLHRKGVLERTIGQWGEVHHTREGVKAYVGYPLFDFMHHPLVNGDFLWSKTKFAPFVFGALATRVGSNRQNRLSCSNEDLLRRVHRRFSDHFGFSMGNFNVRSNTSVIVMRDPAIVIATLMQVQTVYALPFLRDLNRLSEEISGQVPRS